MVKNFNRLRDIGISSLSWYNANGFHLHYTIFYHSIKVFMQTIYAVSHQFYVLNTNRLNPVKLMLVAGGEPFLASLSEGTFPVRPLPPNGGCSTDAVLSDY
jgi:hypothetical protein